MLLETGKMIVSSNVFWSTSPSSHLSLNQGVVEAPQMTSQPTSSIFLCALQLSGTWRNPGLSIPWCSLPTSFCACRVFFPFHCALQDDFGQTWWTGDMSIPLWFVSLYDGQEVFVWSGCLLDFGTDFHVGNMVFVLDAQCLAVAPHFTGSYSSLQLCCEGLWFTSIQKDGCYKRAY